MLPKVFVIKHKIGNLQFRDEMGNSLFSFKLDTEKSRQQFLKLNIHTFHHARRYT